MDRNYDVLFRIMIIGDTGVGKTCLLQRFCDNEFKYSHVNTIGIDFKMKTMVMNGVRVRIQIWDTAGQERYRSITRQYFRKAQGIIMAYDVTDKSSFLSVRDWAADVKEHADKDVNIVLAGNKSDREDSREVTAQQGKALAEEFKVSFHEVSAYTSENVAELFASITSLVLERLKIEVMESLREKDPIPTSESEESEDGGIVTDLESEKPTSSEIVNNTGYNCCQIL